MTQLRAVPADPIGASRLSIIPVSRSEVKRFIAERHHHPVRPGAVFRLGVAEGEQLVGAVVVGKPQVHVTRDRRTAEVLRICTDQDRPDVLEHLYLAVGQTAKAMGFERLIVYGGHGDTVAALKEAGWRFSAPVEVLKFPDTPTAAAERVARRWLWELADR